MRVLRVSKTDFLKGVVPAPPSKSYTIRAVLAASLNSRVRIYNPLFSEDTEAAIGCLGRLGAVIKKGKGCLEIKGFEGRPVLKGSIINVGESGTLLRLILPLIALCQGRITVEARGTLLKRTNQPIVEALKEWGVRIEGKGLEHKIPIRIEAGAVIPGGKVAVAAAISSQTVSSLLMIAPLAREDVEITLKDEPVSRPYIDITLDVLKSSGIRVKRQGYKRFFIKSGQRYEFKKDFFVPGDYSSAAFLMAAGCLIDSDIRITGMLKDKQGDRRIIEILKDMGAKIRHSRNEVCIKGPFNLKGIDIDCRDTPDLVPVLTALGCFARGRTRIYNISHLAHKETNRITAPAKQLLRMGADIRIGPGSLTVFGSRLRPAAVSSCGDHRIAMALAVAGLRIGNLEIADAQAVNKSYPGFVEDMRGLGAKIIACRA